MCAQRRVREALPYIFKLHDYDRNYDFQGLIWQKLTKIPRGFLMRPFMLIVDLTNVIFLNV